jgi:hypothetical protein
MAADDNGNACQDTDQPAGPANRPVPGHGSLAEFCRQLPGFACPPELTIRPSQQVKGF